MNALRYAGLWPAQSRELDPPIRAELFSVERLEQHAESLASAQKITPKPKRVQALARRLYDNTQVLIDTYRVIVKATYERESITPAAEWLLDNFHVVDEQIREIKDDLPPGFYRKLPKLDEGPLEGYPRVFGIAWALVAHTDSAFDLQKLTRFVEAYQRVQPLTIGELWALAITLRITLVENLRRMAEAIAQRLEMSRLADTFADRILGVADRKPEASAAILQSLDQVQWSSAFAVQLVQRLRDRDPNATPALRWLNERLKAEGLTTDQVVRGEVQRQSAMNVTVRNVITSMRLVSMINWAEFFESVSQVDAILRAGSDFAAMDFSTRDLYRRAIEELARESKLDEVEVAQRALAAVKSAGGQGEDQFTGAHHESDPGYYLISNGRRAFEKNLHCRVPLRTRLFRLNSHLGVMSYVVIVATATALILAAGLAFVNYAGVSGWTLALLAAAALIPASDVAVAMMNRVITQQIGASTLPGLELRSGVTADLATIVVVPILLTSVSEAEGQIEKLEVHHLANPDDNFRFALLSDWRDSDHEHSKEDVASLDAAVAGMARLNERYKSAGGPRFFLLHRRRVWNDSEGKWIGWERKRGKLHELNRLLRGATDTTFMALDGRAAALPAGIHYVITLDADTRLPIGTARRLVGKMAHPLNRPRFDPRAGLVVEGHAILQPRVTPSLPIGREGSLFQRAFSGPNGLDPYALAVSDVYQDLFGEGSYCGKGIYDADVFETALHGRIPENTVLSHDLLEGIFARAGLASDIEVVEEFPSRYSVSAARQHRWVRGDWQLLPWIFGFGRKAGDGFNAIPLMGRWKLLDNLRRSLSAPTALLALLIAWMLPVSAAGIWTAFILLTIVLPPLLPAIAHLVPRRTGVSLRSHLATLWSDFALGMLQSVFLVTFLAHQAWMMVDAVSRTLFRVFFHRRRMLEWVSSAHVDDALQFDSRSLSVQVGASAAFAGCIAILIYSLGQHTLLIAAPFAALWVLSPFVAYWASSPPQASGHLSVTRGDELALRLVARRTWRFFEKFVTAEVNMLPPDNFQHDPKPVIANRTSPTNIGLYLLSVVAARDFGWLGLMDATERLEATFATMDKLERFRGHFFNWYDTTDLRPLEPKYVSSVDSGNLAGHLIALGNACGEIAAAPVANPRWLSGLADTLQLIRESLSARAVDAHEANNDKLTAALDAFAATIQKPPSTPSSVASLLINLMHQAESIRDFARERAMNESNAEEVEAKEIVVWSEALCASVHAHKHDIDFLMPWAMIKVGDDAFVATLDKMVTLNELPGHCEAALSLIAQLKDKDEPRDDWNRLADALEKSLSAGMLLSHRLTALAELSNAVFHSMEFGFLFDSDRQLLSIGYRYGDGTLDPNFYDLLASEARLASFIAIAKGDVPAKHWFRLGRTLTPIGGGSALISWSGSMFEYLMPSLVMRAPSGSLLEQTNRLVVRRQEEYAKKLGIPWGISESEYYARDIEQTYQYSSFGVPDLGYKRGLSDNTVIAPYASGLASMVDPASVVRNFSRFTQAGAQGAYGWIEALDYTRSRLPEGTKVALVRAYMAHHQAMIIVAIANALHDGQMRERFHAEPIVKATELLLQERMPQDVAVARPPPELAKATVLAANLSPEILRRYTTAHSHAPRTHLLSNGRYSTMLTAVGSGYSRWHDVAMTRWREDPTCDDWGSYIFLRDVRSGEVWSTGYQPTGIEPDSYEVSFHEDRAEIIRRDGSITTTLDVAVSPEDDAEVRRVSVTNHGNRTREIDLTSYAEVALARQADDAAHPAFSKLFVQTEFVPSLGAILATRRRRSAGDPLVWAAHLAVVEGETSGDVQFETDRARFLGRGHTIRSPAAIADGWPLSNTAGAVLDPIFSLRRRVRIPRGTTARIAFWTLAAASREDILDLADKHHDAMAFERATTLAWTQAQMQRHHLNISVDEAHLFQRLANHVLYSDPTLRPAPDVLARDLRKSSTLWSQGISGDLPIVLVRIEEGDELDLVRQLLRAHEYWRLKQLAVDLVILNDRSPSYAQDLQGEISAIVRMNQSMPKIAIENTRGSVFTLRTDLVPSDVRDLLAASARAVLHGGRGTLTEQINRARERAPANPPPEKRVMPAVPIEPFAPRPPMEFFNGLAGFTNSAREYQTILNGVENTPAPWINVIANPSFGFQVSNEGSGFTWSMNSQQNQLTPWSNDSVSDAPGEAMYLRDEVTGEVWGPTALPIREKSASYSASHGQGYSRFEYASRGIALELLQYVPVEDSVKISRLKIINQSGRERRLSVTAYVEWVLGNSRSAGAPFIVTEIDPQTGALMARNRWNAQFSERVAFVDLNGRQTAWTGDRTEFVGRDGGLERPIGLASGIALSNRVGAGLDPCGVLQTQVRLGVDATTEIVVFLGEGASRAAVQELIIKYRNADLDAVFSEVVRQWDDTLGVVQVKTPDRALDILLNRWLPYQVLACRVWARAAFYQASGAYGFRDQLQDVMALCVSRPDVARAHLLRAAARQFPQGDVQHWWLPDSERGIRTRVSDDKGWLAYVVAHYVNVTGDVAVLDEPVPFLEGPTLHDGERDAFFEASVSINRVSLFDHCALALDSSLAVGAHGLPLMGGGDWNDGMDRVGEEGKGESVWLGWFLFSGLNAFAYLADRQGRKGDAKRWRKSAEGLKEALERNAWDGDWYRRAYFDDGTPLGSVSNSECRIDSIVQSWGVISGAADPTRAARAMAAVDKYLVRRDEKLALLFAPPFDNPARDPGYIKGYPAGIRENGGQYTHAAVWTALAFAMQGDGDKAGELLSMLNPINHADSPTGVHRYKVEPYVVCADLYSMPPHVGRGGWTWYTGSAGWMYNVALEWILGFRLQGANLLLDPCIPRAWPKFEMSFRYRSARYEISVENPLGVSRGVIAVKLDGTLLTGNEKASIPLIDDGMQHSVQIVLGQN